MPVGLRGATVDCRPPAFGCGRARSPFTTAGRVAADRGGRSQYAQAVPPSARTTAAKLPLGSHSHRASRERVDARRPAVPGVTAARRELSSGTRAAGRSRTARQAARDGPGTWSDCRAENARGRLLIYRSEIDLTEPSDGT